VKWAAALIVLTLPAAAASPEACARCHTAQTAKFNQSGMTQAMRAGSGNLHYTQKLGPWTYSVADSTYTVTDGAATLRFPIAWSFGHGTTGQTWLFQRDGTWHESRASYFAGIDGLDITIGQQSITPHNLSEAAGRPIPAQEARQCFSCHATGATPGIQCERCHGSTEAHLKTVNPAPRQLGKLSTEELSDFCGECHRTWSQISIAGPRGIQNVRFQPYRLAGSKCYDAADPRIRCTACHNPHEPLQTTAAAYDAKCQSCHTTTCPVATKDCVTCHMPAVDLPGAHKKFTDHRIRIVKPGEAYPD
jgi:hypothetical protein